MLGVSCRHKRVERGTRARMTQKPRTFATSSGALRMHVEEEKTHVRLELLELRLLLCLVLFNLLCSFCPGVFQLLHAVWDQSLITISPPTSSHPSPLQSNRSTCHPATSSSCSVSRTGSAQLVCGRTLTLPCLLHHLGGLLFRLEQRLDPLRVGSLPSALLSSAVPVVN